MMREQGRDRLVMLAKPPVPGRVMTRLTGPDGWSAEAAAALQAACLADACRRFGLEQPWDMVVCHPGPAEGLAELVPAGVALAAEPERSSADFGALLAAVIARYAGLGRRVVVVASDCPHLPVARLRQAFAALSGRDLVLGPDDGGGCYLIGARGEVDILTARGGLGPVRWSCGRDYRELTRRAAARGVATAHLPPCYDLDRPEDVRRLAREMLTGRVRADELPRTAAVLRQLGLRREGRDDATDAGTGGAAGADAQPAHDPVLPDAPVPPPGP